MFKVTIVNQNGTNMVHKLAGEYTLAKVVSDMVSLMQQLGPEYSIMIAQQA